MRPKIIIWYRNDLRLHDHRALHAALRQDADIIPVYIFDTRQLGKTSFGFPKTGGFRARFLVETVRNLRENLQAIGTDLIVRVGLPEKILPEIARSVGANAIYYGKEVTWEETQVEKKLSRNLSGTGIGVASFWMSTLYYPEDIPYPIEKTPVIFSTFRKGVEKRGRIKEPLPAPKHLDKAFELDPGPIPAPEDLGVQAKSPSELSVLPFRGGETAALERLNEYFWEKKLLKNYKYTRNGLIGPDYSSKFSAWLAVGAISPRYIYEQVKQFEGEVVENVSTYWLVFELIWRDYFRFWAAKNGNNIFFPGGIHPENTPQMQENVALFWKWANGETGMPFIDANMRELNATGFMSNRGRQNVASYLVKDLGISWIMGAEYFESQLVDYDVCSNWGNWAYVAGVGADPRKDRYFNVMSQALRYDTKGQYVRKWLPELKDVPGEKAHYVFELDALQRACFHVNLGADYPEPIVRPASWGIFDAQK